MENCEVIELHKPSFRDGDTQASTNQEKADLGFFFDHFLPKSKQFICTRLKLLHALQTY